ncbi:hypothetical protein OGAPHI_003506 [Ogataea philodendri]|uniref:Uncharacterized protein n=1 Tax=Ogataea philodendri TaxID=1378263 RepID=A0A9P8P784_9ASCO|nr:uncharacterized protein OGAPHI_003506 [Ogataea philodendri]KAH3666510.1 hypothetical protein OGAPHI_003506 [Ogataea philodendri]
MRIGSLNTLKVKILLRQSKATILDSGFGMSQAVLSTSNKSCSVGSSPVFKVSIDLFSSSTKFLCFLVISLIWRSFSNDDLINETVAAWLTEVAALIARLLAGLDGRDACDPLVKGIV